MCNASIHIYYKLDPRVSTVLLYWYTLLYCICLTIGLYEIVKAPKVEWTAAYSESALLNSFTKVCNHYLSRPRIRRHTKAWDGIAKKLLENPVFLSPGSESPVRQNSENY
jgi:hypothetical protein